RHDEAGALEHYQAAAALFLQADCPIQAFEAARKAIQIDPTDERTVELYVSGGLKSGNKEEVRTALHDLIEKTGQRLPYEIFLAQILEEEGKTAEAHAKYLELEPLAYTDPRIREGLTRTLAKPAADDAEIMSSSVEGFTFDEPRTRDRGGVTGGLQWAGGGSFEEQHDPLFEPRPSLLGGQDLAFASGAAVDDRFGPPVPPPDSLWSPETAGVGEDEEDPYEDEEEEAPVDVDISPIESLDEALQEADFYLKLGFREEAKKLLERLLRSYPRDERVRRRAEKVMTIPPEFDMSAEQVELFSSEQSEQAGPTEQAKEEGEAVAPTAAPEEADEDALFADFLKPRAAAEEEIPLEDLFGRQPAEEAAGSEIGSGLFAESAEAVEADEVGAGELAWGDEAPVSTLDLSLDTEELSLTSIGPEDLAPTAEEAQDLEEVAEESEVLQLDLESALAGVELGDEDMGAVEVPPAERPSQAEEDLLQLDLEPTEAASGRDAEETAPLLDLELLETPIDSEGEQVQELWEAHEKADEEDLPVLEFVDLPSAGPDKTEDKKLEPVLLEEQEAILSDLDARLAKTQEAAPTLTSDLIPIEELDEAPTARQPITEPEFDEEIDSALDSLFSGEPLEETPEEVLRYDVAATGSPDDATNPKVHYDLGLAYKEMGLIEDAVQEFQTAAELLNSPVYNPQRILCCSMLANSLLQLGRYSEAHRWAEEGLRIPGKKEFEWKALKYDSASALEKQGKYPEAMEGFREILDRDPEYRDVLARIDNLLRTQ
ncbi:MAG TPA: hypothetical protein PLP42_03615, partial [Acidobacteriota bacterium]|nr:hypothetical protein [Acidobacteriota bacterium]